MKLRIAYEKELKEEMQRQEVSFNIVKPVKFLLLPIVGSLLFATIAVNMVPKVSACGFPWEPMPQKCTSLVNDERVEDK
jgi:hypothetical protein